MMTLPNFGAAVTAAIGCLGLLLPGTVSRVLGIHPEGPLGTSEFRATYGGFFMCLGIGCWLRSPCLYLPSLEQRGARLPWHGSSHPQ